MSRDRFLPVTQQATAGDLERFSATYGTFRWCSCQRWRLRSTPFRAAGKEGRVAALAGRLRPAQRHGAALGFEALRTLVGNYRATHPKGGDR